MSQPLGIQQLMSASEVSVKQKSSMGNKYVFEINGATVLTAKERGSGLLSMFDDGSRGFKIDIFDCTGQAVISLRRPYTFGQDKMEVSLGGGVASVVRREPTVFKPVLCVNDPAGRPVLRVKGPFGTAGQCDFEVLSSSKLKVGLIRRRNTLGAVLVGRDCFLVRFPHDLDVRYKAALLGTCLLIDFLFYE